MRGDASGPIQAAARLTTDRPLLIVLQIAICCPDLQADPLRVSQPAFPARVIAAGAPA